MSNQTPSLRIGLLDNSCHSLKRGYEIWSQWKTSEDAWLLKESVIWVHHGIELALKQLLVQTNEFLVFDDVNKAVERLGILRRKKGMITAGILALFDHDDGVMSVSFKKLLERTAITLPIPELAENEPLRLKIDDLTKYRNKIVHFSIEIDIATISNLLSDILEPLLSVLDREVKDVNFKTTCIPEIRKTARPVQEFSKQIQLEIVDNAIKSTVNALPPEGNRKAGIVWQIMGTGLGSSFISYLNQARLLSRIRDNHVIVIAERIDLVRQVYKLISNLASHDDTVRISFPESKTALEEALKSREPKIIVSTIQKFDQNTIATDKECLLVGYNLLNLYESLAEMFPNAICILFTSVPPHQNSTALRVFGEIVGKYDFRQALIDHVATPIRVETRRLEVAANSSSAIDSIVDLPSDLLTEFNQGLGAIEFVKIHAKDIAQDFELRQKNWTGKGVVIIPDRAAGIALFKALVEIRPNWSGHTEYDGLVKTISLAEDPAQRSILLERFRDQTDSLSLAIVTGNFLLGLDNPLISTIYVLSSVSLQLSHTLAGFLSRPYPGKESGLIVDYMGLNWNFEELL